MLVPMLRTLGQVQSVRVRRLDRPARLMALGVLVGAGLLAAALVVAVAGSPHALLVGALGALVQVGSFVGALWWTLRLPRRRCDRGS
jgi:hypothetical protein